MSRFSFIFLVGIVFLTACDGAKQPSDSNFRKAINQYLGSHGKACTWIGGPFPIDVSQAGQKLASGTGGQMAVLEGAGLVRSSDMVAPAPSIFGPGAPRRVKRYQPTEAGNKYLQQAPGVFGQIVGLCYGDKTVDSIVKWTEPGTVGTGSRSEVTYVWSVA